VIKLSAMVAAIVLIAGPAVASDELSSVGKPSIRVATSDLDLSQPSGQAALKKRINKAITKACYPAEAYHPDLTAKRDCAREIETKADTIAQQLTAQAVAPRLAQR
jgi:UrcA family protein